VKAIPDRVAAFRAASVKGWGIRLAHKQATVDLILRSYRQKKPRGLLFEAAADGDAGRPGSRPDREQDPAAGEVSPRLTGNLGC